MRNNNSENLFSLLQECCGKGVNGCCLNVNQNKAIVNHTKKNDDQNVSSAVLMRSKHDHFLLTGINVHLLDLL